MRHHSWPPHMLFSTNKSKTNYQQKNPNVRLWIGHGRPLMVTYGIDHLSHKPRSCNSFQHKLMAVTKNLLLFLLLLHCCYYSCFFVEFATATDSITINHSIKGSEIIVSNNSVFELGFFSPVNSTNRYIGIWYSFSPNVVVWVANRDKPLRDNSNGILKISMDGNLVLSDAKGQVLWSSSNSTTSSETTMAGNNSSSSAQLLDTGNLVLKDYQGSTIWESFLHPSDTFLPKMRLVTKSKQHRTYSLLHGKAFLIYP